MSNILIINILDNSGSMGEAASTDIEFAGFTRNDLSRQGAMLCATACPEEIYMGIIAFNSDATIISEPVKMNALNKQKLCSDIRKIKTGGGTEIMSGINLAVQMIEQSRILYGITQCYIKLFTDGEDNTLSENNAESIILRLAKNGEFEFKMDTVGFGPSANTQLLVKMANLCSGTYSLCFDGSMVGTIFGRSLARTYIGAHAFGIYEPETLVPRVPDFYIQKTAYHNFRGKLVNILLNQFYRFLPERINAINQINSEIEDWLQSNNQNDLSEPNFYGLICALHADLNNQIRMAVSDPTLWTRWGKAYWQTIGMALDKQYAPNFKDQCLQGFGSQFAKDEYERISGIYDTMPMIPPSGNINERISAVPSTPASFNDRSGGCFHPNSLLELADGYLINLEEIEQLLKLKKPVIVKNNSTYSSIEDQDYNYKLVTIECIVKTNCSDNPTKFCKIGSTILTPTHPILINNIWMHPKTITNIYEEQVSHVFNIILKLNPESDCTESQLEQSSDRHVIKRDNNVLINGLPCITLGHGIENDQVATDSFWGSEDIVNKLKELYPDEYQSGIINFRHKFIRNEITGFIDEII